MKHTIVESSFEYIDKTKENYLTFLEKCARVCYKSEEKICEGSAKKLLQSIVMKNHLSVLEHENCILDFYFKDDFFYEKARDFICSIIYSIPLFGFQFAYPEVKIGDWEGSLLRIGGNIRMWTELLKETDCHFEPIRKCISTILFHKYPLFFVDMNNSNDIQIVEENELSDKEKERFCTLTYKIVCSRIMAQQLTRHRLCSFSMESQRYCNYNNKGFQFIKPQSIKFEDLTYDKWYLSCVNSCRTYLELLEKGIKPEDARFVLPNSLKTEIVITANLKQWKHIFMERASNKNAQWEIRQIMQGIEKHAKTIYPEIFGE